MRVSRSSLASATVLALLLAGTVSMLSCGDVAVQPSAQVTGASETNETETEETGYQYQYPTLDLGGADFTILNTHQEYSFYETLDLDATTGDGLDDAVYARNRKLEQQFNFKLKVNNEYLLDAAATALKNSVLAQDNAFDVAFIRDYYMATPITEGYLLDMSNCEQLHFNEPWWDSEVIEASRLGSESKILYAFTDISFVDFEGTICTFFNERIFDNLDIAHPYQDVLNGTWTLDRMHEILSATANLNGDSDFTWRADGQATYGLLSWDQCADAMIIGADLDYFTVDKDKNIQLATDGERFYTRALKVIDILSEKGHYLHLNDSGDSHYEMAFKHGRCALLVAELKASNKYRDMDDTYGIVPMPKYDEAQETYRNLRGFLYVMCVPATCQDLSKVGTVMDAMSYLTYAEVMPYFYNSHLSQKMLRNEESIQMLDIIRQTRYNDIGIPFGLADIIRAPFRNAVTNGSTDLASKVEKLRAKIDKTITKAMDALNEQ